MPYLAVGRCGSGRAGEAGETESETESETEREDVIAIHMKTEILLWVLVRTSLLPVGRVFRGNDTASQPLHPDISRLVRGFSNMDISCRFICVGNPVEGRTCIYCAQRGWLAAFQAPSDASTAMALMLAPLSSAESLPEVVEWSLDRRL